MTEPLDDTWAVRDLPNLRRIVRALETNDEPAWPIDVEELCEREGLDPDEFGRSAQALRNGGYIQDAYLENSNSNQVIAIRSVSRAAYEATGQWPTADVATDRLIQALRELAEGGRTEEVRTRAERVLGALQGAGRDIAVGMATAVLGGAIT